MSPEVSIPDQSLFLRPVLAALRRDRWTRLDAVQKTAARTLRLSPEQQAFKSKGAGSSDAERRTVGALHTLVTVGAVQWRSPQLFRLAYHSGMLLEGLGQDETKIDLSRLPSHPYENLDSPDSPLYIRRFVDDDIVSRPLRWALKQIVFGSDRLPDKPPAFDEYEAAVSDLVKAIRVGDTNVSSRIRLLFDNLQLGELIAELCIWVEDVTVGRDVDKLIAASTLPLPTTPGTIVDAVQRNSMWALRAYCDRDFVTLVTSMLILIAALQEAGERG